MPRVYNKYHRDAPPDAVNIMRPSPLGNPFKIGPDGTREEVVAKYRVWIVTKPKLLAIVADLRGRDLVCCCAPRACHGDVVLEMANPTPCVAPGNDIPIQRDAFSWWDRLKQHNPC